LFGVWTFISGRVARRESRSILADVHSWWNEHGKSFSRAQMLDRLRLRDARMLQLQ
jgi:hypothetical protein